MRLMALKITIDHKIVKDLVEVPGLYGTEKLLGFRGCEDNHSFGEKAFYRFILKHMLSAALSQREREALHLNDEEMLRRAASRFRLDAGPRAKGAEIAEICLYGVMSEYYKAASSVPKIFYKQSAGDQAKGADSVHIVLDGEGGFSIWYGEAKFYKTLSSAIYKDVTSSLIELLSSNRLEYENHQIVGMPELKSDLIDDELYNRIQSVLDLNGISSELIAVLHVPILILYGSRKFFAKEENIIEQQKRIAEGYFMQHLLDLKPKLPFLSEIKFHLILFPVPDKESIVNQVEEVVRSYRGRYDK